jgi:hypothetical protein
MKATIPVGICMVKCRAKFLVSLNINLGNFFHKESYGIEKVTRVGSF